MKDTPPSAMRSSSTPAISCKSSRISPYIPVTPLSGCQPRSSALQCQLSLSLQTSQDQTEPNLSRMPHSLGTPSTVSVTISSSGSGTVSTSPALRTTASCTHRTYEDILESFKGPYYGWHWVYSNGPLGPGTSGKIDGNLQVKGAEEFDGADVDARN